MLELLWAGGIAVLCALTTLWGVSFAVLIFDFIAEVRAERESRAAAECAATAAVTEAN